MSPYSSSPNCFVHQMATRTPPELAYTEAMMNGFSESQLPKQFREEYQVLVVAEKYQAKYQAKFFTCASVSPSRWAAEAHALTGAGSSVIT